MLYKCFATLFPTKEIYCNKDIMPFCYTCYVKVINLEYPNDV